MAAAKPHDAVSRLRATELDLVVLLSGLDTAALRRRPDPAEWSPLQVVCHLADAEMVYGVRFRLILTGDRPWLSAYDQEAWAERLTDNEPEVKDVVNRWRVTRDANIRLLASLQPAEWERVGMHAERGEESMVDVANVLADHDRAHLDQLRRLLP
jgi:hypothetical protein